MQIGETMIHTIKNEYLTVKVNDLGAELMSMEDEKETEYLWEGKKEFWQRRSPILFPVVGSLIDKKYRYQGREYKMSQHGFARDMEFTLVEKKEAEIWHRLCSDSSTKEIYPFDFCLEIGYRLEGRVCKVLWRVTNEGTEPMYFSIGGHPAFYCPKMGENKAREQYYLAFGQTKELEVSKIDVECSLAMEEKEILKLPMESENGQDGLLPIDNHLFDEDALVIENHQTHRISLCGSNKKPYLTVCFDAPLFGVWSPLSQDGKIAPFICIEPWYGRCDKKGFKGELAEREWGNTLKAKEIFEAGYSICIEE